MHGLYRYPEKAKFGKIIPKAKIYEHAKLKPAQKAKFVELIQQIRWAYKLASHTTNLPVTNEVKEIQILRIRITRRELPDDILYLIDSAIPSMVIFELINSGLIRVKTAPKMRKTERTRRAPISIYFASDWMDMESKRSDLPQAINLGNLYDKLLNGLLNPEACSDKEVPKSSSQLAVYQKEIRAKETEITKIKQKLRRTRQFNKKQEINSMLKKAKSDLERLLKTY